MHGPQAEAKMQIYMFYNFTRLPKKLGMCYLILGQNTEQTLKNDDDDDDYSLFLSDLKILENSK
mgnify:FL=1